MNQTALHPSTQVLSTRMSSTWKLMNSKSMMSRRACWRRKKKKSLIEHFIALQIEKRWSCSQNGQSRRSFYSNSRIKINQSSRECSKKTENHELFCGTPLYMQSVDKRMLRSYKFAISVLRSFKAAAASDVYRNLFLYASAIGAAFSAKCGMKFL